MLTFQFSPRNFPQHLHFEFCKCSVCVSFLGQIVEWLLQIMCLWELDIVLGLKLNFNTLLDMSLHEKNT